MCISAKTGTYILGCLTMLALLSEIEEFIPARFGPNIAMVACFIAMVVNDTETTRHAYYVCYMVGNIALLIVNFWMAQRAIFKE